MCCGDRMIESGIKKGVTRGLWQRRSNRKSILTDNFLFYRFIHGKCKHARLQKIGILSLRKFTGTFKGKKATERKHFKGKFKP